MRLATKILLLMLLITVGTSATLSWVVTYNVTRYERRRANERIAQTIGRYVSRLEERHAQVEKIARALLEAPIPRSQFQLVDDSKDAAAIEQLRQEILGRTVQEQLTSPSGAPAFHVVVNYAGAVLLAVAPGDPQLEVAISSKELGWPVDPVLSAPRGAPLVSRYVTTPQGLFLAMAVPLHTQLDQPPALAYFVGFRVDDDWARRQLVAERLDSSSSADAPLSAWFLVDHKVNARASADPQDQRIASFTANTALARHDLLSTTTASSRAFADVEAVEFRLASEQYLGRSFDLETVGTSGGELVLASSLDQALLPLRALQKQILLCTIVACGLSVILCRWIAHRIADPIAELVEGTQRIAAGQFEQPVKTNRSDELGMLATAFNEMSNGLKERDALREQQLKIERDLALARKIQMDLLPKFVPPCPGYDLATFSHPAEETGGDIYDLVGLALDDDRPGHAASVVLFLADATGHGVGPALCVTQVRAMLRIGVRLRTGLADLIAQVNRQLCQDYGAERFVTAFLGLLDPSGHSVEYHSAGQAPLLHFRARDKECRWIGCSTIPLGIDEEPDGLGAQRIEMAPGDLFVLLTDGFYEFQNAAGDMFGEDRVGKYMIAHHCEPAKEILGGLVETIQNFGNGSAQVDDMTALIIKRHAS